MPIDPGLVVVIVAVLIFYLRLIIIQRQRAKQQARPLTPGKGKTKKDAPQPQDFLARYSILSPNKWDRVIGGIGLFAILLGILTNAGFAPLLAVRQYWWLPTATGIIAFSWAFKL